MKHSASAFVLSTEACGLPACACKRVGLGPPLVAVKRPANKPELMTVEWSFGIDCGNDSVLLVYEFDHGWKRIVRWQSGDYSEISGAFGDFFQYAVVPLGAAGDWAVAVAHGHPWCTSRWSGFDLDVISPAHNRSQQLAIFIRAMAM